MTSKQESISRLPEDFRGRSCLTMPGRRGISRRRNSASGRRASRLARAFPGPSPSMRFRYQVFFAAASWPAPAFTGRYAPNGQHYVQCLVPADALEPLPLGRGQLESQRPGHLLPGLESGRTRLSTSTSVPGRRSRRRRETAFIAQGHCRQDSRSPRPESPRTAVPGHGAEAFPAARLISNLQAGSVKPQPRAFRRIPPGGSSRPADDKSPQPPQHTSLLCSRLRVETSGSRANHLSPPRVT